jgi:hypothetical protein
LSDLSPKGFNGQFQFLGGPAFPYLGPVLQPGLTPNQNGNVSLLSIQQYLATVQLLDAGYTSQQVANMGYGPSKYTVNTGDPYLSFYQLDFGPFVQDDWRVKPNRRPTFPITATGRRASDSPGRRMQKAGTDAPRQLSGAAGACSTIALIFPM